jgi:hypothetical protein
MRKTLLLLIVLAALLLSGCGRVGVVAPKVDPALATLIPADTAIMVGGKLDKLRETEVYKKHFSNVAIPRLDDFARDTGLDPRKDVWDVLFCSNGSNSGVLMARGKFTQGELEPRLEREGATRMKHKGYNLFGNEETAVFFMNASTALAGSTPVLRNIIDHRDQSGGGIPAPLRPLIDALPADSQVWAVFNSTGINLPFAGKGTAAVLEQLLRSVENGRFSADLRSGFAFDAVGNCTSDESAKQIHDLLKAAIGFGRLSTPNDQPELLKVYDAINVQRESQKVNITADVPQELVDKFIDTFVARGRRDGL